MSEFDADWLALREVADERSRARLPPDLLRRSRREGPLRILDLGSGTGANLRYLAPRIGGAQTWLLTDVSPRLLGATESRMQASDWRIEPGEAELQGELLSGWAEAAARIAPHLHDRLETWYRNRNRLLMRGLSRLMVGHQDLFGRCGNERGSSRVTGFA